MPLVGVLRREHHVLRVLHHTPRDALGVVSRHVARARALPVVHDALDRRARDLLVWDKHRRVEVLVLYPVVGAAHKVLVSLRPLDVARHLLEDGVFAVTDAPAAVGDGLRLEARRVLAQSNVIDEDSGEVLAKLHGAQALPEVGVLSYEVVVGRVAVAVEVDVAAVVLEDVRRGVVLLGDDGRRREFALRLRPVVADGRVDDVLVRREVARRVELHRVHDHPGIDQLEAVHGHETRQAFSVGRVRDVVSVLFEHAVPEVTKLDLGPIGGRVVPADDVERLLVPGDRTLQLIGRLFVHWVRNGGIVVAEQAHALVDVVHGKVGRRVDRHDLVVRRYHVIRHRSKGRVGVLCVCARDPLQEPMVSQGRHFDVLVELVRVDRVNRARARGPM